MNHQGDDGHGGSAVKRCTCCGHPWSTLDAFLGDPELEVAGYQADFDDLPAGLFLFNHLTCGSTIAMAVEFFRDLYEGPIHSERATGTAALPRVLPLCLRAWGVPGKMRVRLRAGDPPDRSSLAQEVAGRRVTVRLREGSI
jgi:hypothetical protein